MLLAELAACASSSGPVGSTTRTRIIDPVQAKQVDVDVHTHASADDRTLALPVVTVFDAIPDAYRQLGVKTVAVVDTSGGVYTVGVRNLLVHGSLGGVRLARYLDCGGSAMRSPVDNYDISFSATSAVAPSGNGSVLHTLVSADARDPTANTPPVHCTSTGAFESAIADAVTKAASGTK
jgi:hypothetical protein